MQGKDPSVEFTQDIVEESEDERCFDDMMTGSDSVPPIELPAADMGRLEEISELVSISELTRLVLLFFNSTRRMVYKKHREILSSPVSKNF